jgi:transcriptional regulator GlxA family with amidase domain
MPARHLDLALVDRVATAALGWELEHDYWERQGAMTALLSWGHPQAEPTVRRWLDRAVETQTRAGWLCYGAFFLLAAHHLRAAAGLEETLA